MKAKKSLGQNFLQSTRALDTIVSAGKVSEDDVVLEIGPGKGALTEKLLARSLQLIAIEKDDELYGYLKTKFAKEIEEGKLILIHGDVLEFELTSYQLQATNYKVVANIPYNLTGAIIRKFLSADYQPEMMVLLVQKEVAERIARSKKESILSFSVKAYGKPKYIETVKAGSFAPAPKVDSAILAIEDISKDFFEGFTERHFFDILHAGFSSKRKKLSSNLRELFEKEEISSIFTKLGLSDNTRAEDVGIETWKKLAQELKGQS